MEEGVFDVVQDGECNEGIQRRRGEDAERRSQEGIYRNYYT